MARRYYYRTFNEQTGRELSDRMADLKRALDFKPTYRVLDIGCAEGLISLELAPFVSEIRAVDMRPARIQAAQRLAENLRIHNVQFEIASLFDLTLDPLSYDIVLFLGVYHQLPQPSRERALRIVLHSAKHQVAIRTRIHRDFGVRDTILNACREEGFEITFERTYESARARKTRGLRIMQDWFSHSTTTLHKSLKLVASRVTASTFLFSVAAQILCV